MTSALIVLGGTIGAVMITTPLPVLIRAVKKLGQVFFGKEESVGAAIDEIIGYASQARKEGIVSLETQAAEIADPFLSKALESSQWTGSNPTESARLWNSRSSSSKKM